MRLANSQHAASHADLRFCADDRPGISRRRYGKTFRYFTSKGRPVRGADQSRIAALVIPPAWKSVWISPYSNGHLQATGIDARGRKQYRYHTDWTRHRNLSKFDGLL